jgi:hypothetical protein
MPVRRSVVLGKWDEGGKVAPDIGRRGEIAREQPRDPSRPQFLGRPRAVHSYSKNLRVLCGLL